MTSGLLAKGVDNASRLPRAPTGLPNTPENFQRNLDQRGGLGREGHHGAILDLGCPRFAGGGGDLS
eukprot:9455903-Pyramimonas_sp.AAC.1